MVRNSPSDSVFIAFEGKSYPSFFDYYKNGTVVLPVFATVDWREYEGEEDDTH